MATDSCCRATQMALVLATNLLCVSVTALVYKVSWLQLEAKTVALVCYVGVQSIISCSLLVADKYIARRDPSGVGEVYLHVYSFFGGVVGTILAMICCCHKVQKMPFVVVTLLLIPFNAFWLLLTLLILT